MEISVYEDRAKQIITEIKDAIDAKGITSDFETEGSVITQAEADEIFAGKSLPNLIQFLALCAISGITINVPSVETPDNPM